MADNSNNKNNNNKKVKKNKKRSKNTSKKHGGWVNKIVDGFRGEFGETWIQPVLVM